MPTAASGSSELIDTTLCNNSPFHTGLGYSTLVDSEETNAHLVFENTLPQLGQVLRRLTGHRRLHQVRHHLFFCPQRVHS